MEKLVKTLADVVLAVTHELKKIDLENKDRYQQMIDQIRECQKEISEKS